MTAYDGQWQHFNRYAYAYNNPYAFTDPDGRRPVCLFAAPVILGGATGALADYAIQKAVNPGQPVNKVEVAVAGAAGAISGGIGGALVGAVDRGTVSVGTAVSVQAVGNAAASAIGATAGDFAGAAAKGTLQRMASSSAPGVPNIASTTASTGTAIPRQGFTQAAGSQTGQAAAQTGIGAAQKDLEKKK
ncbi:hypothetical protein [Pseudoxanthomonas sp. UTMC 1351]|uniref:hypothetical protein n=1 Tax=Pseudoxanthomonas sp. UTMC 1351 TaxID=2695853 RepID=UPI0034CDBE88